MKLLLASTLISTLAIGQTTYGEESDQSEPQDDEAYMLSFEIRKAGKVTASPTLITHVGKTSSITYLNLKSTEKAKNSDREDTLGYKFEVTIHSRDRFVSDDGDQKTQLLVTATYHDQIEEKWKVISRAAFDKIVVGEMQSSTNGDHHPGAGLSLMRTNAAGNDMEIEEFAIQVVSAALSSGDTQISQQLMSQRQIRQRED